MLMRLAAALGAVAQGAMTVADAHAQALDWAIGLPEMLIGVGLMLGFMTPLSGGAGALGSLALGVWWWLSPAVEIRARAAAFAMAVICAALVLLGPGAFSVDAYLFGPREIIIPEAPRGSGS